jgi:hypothetical protein
MRLHRQRIVERGELAKMLVIWNERACRAPRGAPFPAAKCRRRRSSRAGIRGQLAGELPR